MRIFWRILWPRLTRPQNLAGTRSLEGPGRWPVRGRVWRRLWLSGAAILAAFPALADFDDGVAAFRRGEYDLAIGEWQPLADAGHASAQFNLAQMYRRGLGVPADLVRAERYYREAALQGHRSAQANLASLYFTKQPPQPKEAIYFWRLAARQGDAISQYQMGVQYFNGEYVVRDRIQAYAWMVLAADKGLADAKNALSQMRQYLSAEETEKGAALAVSLQQEIEAGAGKGISSVPLQPSAPAAPETAGVPAPTPAPAPAEQDVSTVQSEPLPPPEPVVVPAPPPVVAEAPPAPEPPPAPAPEPAPVETASPRDVPSSATEPGPDRWRVQIAARRDEADARNALDKISRAYPALLAGTETFVQRADLGATGIYYRAPLGRFAERGPARDLCGALKAAGTDCFVTRSPAE